MTLTTEEIEMIEREAKRLYPIDDTLTKSGEDKQFLKMQAFHNGARFVAEKLLEERERSKKLLEAEEERTNYWVSRCMAAEQCIEKSPCDPDVTKEQIEAHRIWEAAKKNENNNQ